MANQIPGVIKGWIGGAIGTIAMVLPAAPALAHPEQGILPETWLNQPLTPGLTFTGLCLAFLVGSSHALAPGHGKTMVAAYLVGTRGTVQQALLLGLITTITHTLGVFALGIATLFASHYILPEQLYPILSFVSGITICGLGLWLLNRQLHGFSHSHAAHHSHEYSHDHSHHHSYQHIESHSHSIHPPHIDYSALESGVTGKSLLALGVAGGLVPCPSAVVLLLSAISVHQVGYGLLLVSAFSLGLAIVLSAIGISVVYAQQWFNQSGHWLHDRFPLSQTVVQKIPILSAIVVILVGAVLSTHAMVR